MDVNSKKAPSGFASRWHGTARNEIAPVPTQNECTRANSSQVKDSYLPI